MATSQKVHSVTFFFGKRGQRTVPPPQKNTHAKRIAQVPLSPNISIEETRSERSPHPRKLKDHENRRIRRSLHSALSNAFSPLLHNNNFAGNVRPILRSWKADLPVGCPHEVILVDKLGFFNKAANVFEPDNMLIRPAPIPVPR